MTPQAVREANRLAEARDLRGAWQIVDDALEKDPDDIHALVLAGFLCEREPNKIGVGYVLAQRAVSVAPNMPEAWTNLGRMADMLWRGEEAKECFRRALKRNDHPKGRALVMLNLSAVYVQEGKWAEARKWAEQCLELDPSNKKARHNLGMCLLAQGDWARGWDEYGCSVGNTPNRPQWKYANEQQWTGQGGGSVVIYGEQGIGDEICAASMFPDAIERAGHVILECDARLAGLYRRSFPKASVYGTRNKLEVAWDAKDCDPDYSISSFQLGAIFRRSADAFPRVPYLVPDPHRVALWKREKPRVGIAWTGGTKNTAKHLRRWSLEQLLPMLQQFDADFVALQYTDCGEEVRAFNAEHGTAIQWHPEVTLSKDYDDTAALVASLDAVVSVPTSVAHLAGAMGVPAIVTQSPFPCWKFAAGVPFHPLHIVPTSIKAATDKLHEVLHAPNLHRVRPQATAGVQRTATLDCPALV